MSQPSEYQRSRLNIFIEPRLRFQAEMLARESGQSVTAVITRILEKALAAHLQQSSPIEEY
jgi:hypothetical protein